MSDTSPREPLGRRFTAHLTATGMANLGDGIVQTGVPLYALTLTRSPSQIALLTAAVWLPWLLLGLAAGVVVDRRDRRHPDGRPRRPRAPARRGRLAGRDAAP